ncbi:MAG TPA: AraC family transcriptional regulator [Gemmatimonadales bacterium]|nr:AraC family transcriptional regulator [Gemmatimonadales bacterium]
MVRRAIVPITMGSSGARTLAAGSFLVSELRFAPDMWLSPHVHDRASLAVMLEGSFDLGITRRVYPCEPGSVAAEPVEERHSNRVGRAGAHVLAIQPEPGAADRLGPCAELFDEVRHARRSPLAVLAWSMVRELRAPDSVTLLAVEGLSLEMVALALRESRAVRRGRLAPGWLTRVRDCLQDRFLDPPTLGELATDASVHPDYLARAFRAWFGQPIGRYVRRLRLEWAAERLAVTAIPIVQIAFQAGFADQSHFTRAFKRHIGVAPGDYRRSVWGLSHFSSR